MEQESNGQSGWFGSHYLWCLVFIRRISCFVCVSCLYPFPYNAYHNRTFVRQQLGLTGASCATDPNCISATVPLLKNQRKGLIDPDTPASAMTKTSHDGTKLNLVVCVLPNGYNDRTNRTPSFLMNSTKTDALSTAETTRTLRLLISGMV